jgi:LPXTG-motif cell wall-anchored protein
VVRDDDGALRRQYRDGRGDDELIVRRFEQCLELDVLRDTIPNKRLPDTGGAPLLGLAALGIASLVAGASVVGAITRGGR